MPSVNNCFDLNRSLSNCFTKTALPTIRAVHVGKAKIRQNYRWLRLGGGEIITDAERR